MSQSNRLERRYLRLLMLYPASFRAEHGAEILGVLMADAEGGRERPQLGEALDLLRSALTLRLRPGVPRSTPTVFAAVRVMCLGAALEAATLVTIVTTLGAMRSAVLARHPHFNAAEWHAVLVSGVLPDLIGGTLCVWVWLWLAWANGRGHRWARPAFAAFFGVTTYSLLSGVVQGSATYAVADLAAATAMWLSQLAALVLIYLHPSREHYRSRSRGVGPGATRRPGPAPPDRGAAQVPWR